MKHLISQYIRVYFHWLEILMSYLSFYQKWAFRQWFPPRVGRYRVYGHPAVTLFGPLLSYDSVKGTGMRWKRIHSARYWKWKWFRFRWNSNHRFLCNWWALYHWVILSVDEWAIKLTYIKYRCLCLQIERQYSHRL